MTFPLPLPSWFRKLPINSFDNLTELTSRKAAKPLASNVDALCRKDCVTRVGDYPFENAPSVLKGLCTVALFTQAVRPGFSFRLFFFFPRSVTNRCLASRAHASLVQRTAQSRSQSFVPLDQRSENESSGSNHYERTKEITEFWLSGSLRICIYGACLKWLLPELSFSDRWSRGTKLWERDCVRHGSRSCRRVKS